MKNILNIQICKTVFFLMLLNVCMANNPVDRIHFYKGSLDDGKALAGIEGKLAYVQFSADWCSPCKWMEKTTYNDQRVTNMLNDNYIPIKIDIDDFDGFAWKQEYDVVTLPTILIFNSSGKIVERIEKTVTANDLVGILDVHNYDENKVFKRHKINKSPTDLRKSMEENDVVRKPSTERSKYAVSSGKSSYKLAVGVHSDYEAALNQYQMLNQQFVEPIIVLNDIKDGKTRFKIYMGDFKTEEEALDYKKILKERFSIESEVK